MNFSIKYKKLGLLSLVCAVFLLLLSCNSRETKQLYKVDLDREAPRSVYQKKCSPCHVIGHQLIGPALVDVADHPDTLVKKYKSQEKCHLGVGKASEKELNLIIEYLKINNVFPDSLLNSF
ncbi:c-type cytochrome [Nubsella zeaxanthinifaciens]|uniref:c-type cytochrome n=1 Tax=Nubsella zeaxanthinifaciens TaxID=392412 RepID=UPI003D03E20D